jgi:hypothetical protein
MPERLAADKKQRIEQAHTELLAALQGRGVRLSETEAQRLREKLAAYIGKTNPEHIDIPTLRDAIAEKVNGSPQARARMHARTRDARPSFAARLQTAPTGRRSLPKPQRPTDATTSPNS